MSAMCDGNVAARFRRRGRCRFGGFSLIEVLIALALSATLMAATLQALDAAWRGYRQTTEAASTHVVSRIMMHRMLAMIRTGSDFAPYPIDYFSEFPPQQRIEFLTAEDSLNGVNRLTAIEFREGEDGAAGALWLEMWDMDTNPPQMMQEQRLLTGVLAASFSMEFEPGPRLIRATIDLTVEPNDSEAMRTRVGGETPAIRLVASASPRMNN